MESANQIRNKKVETALLKAAMGFEYDEVRTTIVEKNGKKETRVEKTRKYYPLNTGAMQFWLKNKVPHLWNDRRELIVDTKNNEDARKQVFLEMINEDIVDAEYKEVEDNESEQLEDNDSD